MKYLLVAGARPNFMKIAPIMRAFSRVCDGHSPADLLLVHTGQHYGRNMSDDFFRDLGIPEPDIDLEVGSGTHAEQTARIMMAFEPACIDTPPRLGGRGWRREFDCRLRSTASKLGIRVAHVEAGLRSRDMSMPEEINRLCTDVISDLLFTTDMHAQENLRNEGVSDEKIYFVGNTMIDTLRLQIGRARQMPLPGGLAPGNTRSLLCIAPPMWTLRNPAPTLGAITEIAHRIPIVFPVHPRTAPRLNGVELYPRIRIPVEPLSYLPFLGLVAFSRMVLTDSGGIQEETTVLGIPCLTMRPNTERPITCELGSNILVGTDPQRIVREARSILDGHTRLGAIPEKWDGCAGERIVEVLLSQPVQAPRFICG